MRLSKELLGAGTIGFERKLFNFFADGTKGFTRKIFLLFREMDRD